MTSTPPTTASGDVDRAAPASSAPPEAPQAPDRPRTARAVALGLIAAVVFGVVVVLDVLGRGVPVPVEGAEQGPGWSSALVGLILVVAGATVVRVRPRQAVAWVLVVSGALWLLSGLAASWFVLAWAGVPGPGAGLAFQVSARYCSAIVVTIPLALLLYPDGRFPRPWPWRLAAFLALAAVSAMVLGYVFAPYTDIAASRDRAPSPEMLALGIDTLSVPLPFWEPLLAVGFAVAPLSMVVAVAVLVGRYRRARDVRRLQMRWLLWAGLVELLVVGLVLLPVSGVVIDALLFVAVAVTSGVVALALARTGLTVVDRLLPATLVVAMLAAGVVAVDLVILLATNALVGGRDAGLIAVAVVAIAYTPLRTWLWRLARRTVRGTRDDPAGTIATLADRLESASVPDAQLDAVARAVAAAFRLPWVRVEVDRADGARAIVDHGDAAPSAGPSAHAAVDLPLRYRDETIGRVALPASAYVALSRRDQRLLADMLRQAAGAARAGALSASLQRARADLVTAREEERRRLRRDLHDSVGPGLGAVTLRIETARGLAPRDPERADAVLAQAVTDVAAQLADVRRLVHDLRPPALDELGLAGALRAQARRLGGDGLAITVRGDAGDVGEVPAAVEVAAFRIASEAMTNVVRHAAATHATVTLERSDGQLVVTVTDDGRGIAPDVAAGVGTLSLRERAAELGGRTTITCPPTGGTTVTAHLPV
ncbi:sensor histidine kinase [Actinomycetospora aeridis]|uniref:histidine kinase n=1 Tax=Actinomycetospora aeridis TaxID=3129231 RepID=A0ABU8N3T2_9PSEU